MLPDPRRPGKWRKTVLLLVIDDHSCYCPHAQFYPDQKMPRLERTVRKDTTIRIGSNRYLVDPELRDRTRREPTT